MAIALACFAAALFGPVASSEASTLPWTQQSPATTPPARANATMSYDEATGKLVLFGGFGSSADEHTWTYDGTDWAQQATATSPPERAWASMTYDAALGEVVLFGGFGGGLAFRGDTWTYDGHDWTERSPVTSPSPRYFSAMAYDPAIRRVVLFGGSGEGILDDTWTYDGAGWSRQTPATSPPALGGAVMAYDAAIGEIVLFGGSGPGGVSSETWTYDGNTWIRRSPATSPPPNYAGSMSYDEATGKLVLFGGRDAGEHDLGDTWTYDGTTWTEQSPTASPSPRQNAAMAFDAATGTTVLFGGEGTAGYLGDTWSYRVAAPPRATIGAPLGGGTFTPGASVPTSFSCADAPGGTGIESCVDSAGATSGAGRLDTSTLGPHTYTVTARSRDGEVGTSSISYTVVPVPPVVTPPPAPTCTVPALKGRKLKGAKKRVRAADCKVGKLRKRDGATAKHGAVAAQQPRPGVEVPAGTKVRITLAP